MRGMHSKWDLVVLSLCVVLVLMTAGAVNELGTEEAFRQTCSRNLATLSKTMEVYSKDYEDELPMAGGRECVWGPTIPNWMARTSTEAFGIDLRGGRGGKSTTTASFYLLVKYAEAHTPDFACPSERATRVFTLDDAKEELPKGFELIYAWDFGGRYDDCNNPSRHCSYAYHMPFDRKRALTLAHDAGMAVLADRSPWIDPKRVHDADLGWDRFVEDLGHVHLGNSDAHRREGQNVLFVDGHAAFQTRAACGVDGDNIYTIASSQPGPGTPKETLPQVYGSARPAHRKDSVLVQELPYVLAEPPVFKAFPQP